MLIASPSPHSHLHPHHHRHTYTCHQRYFSLFSHLVVLLLFLSFSPYLDAQDGIDYTTPLPSSTSTSTFPNITDFGNTTNTTLIPPPKNDTRVSNKSYTYQFLISMLVPITGSSLQIQFGLPQRAATEMAIAEINSRNDLLKNVNLRLEYKDTGGSSGTAFFRSLEVCEFCAGPSTPNTTSRSVVIIGPSYTSEATSAAFVASKCNLTIVGTSPTSNTLADPITYPTYSRVIPNDLFQAEIAARFCAAFGWKRVATLSSALQAPADLINNFASNAVMYNVSIQLSTSYPANISSASDAEPALQLIRQSRARIIVLSGSSADSIFVFEAAKRMGMTKPPYVWFCIGGIVNAASAATNYANAPNIIGLTNYVNTSAPAYTSWVNRWTSSNFTKFGVTTPNLQAAYQYDGVYLIAYALDRIMRGIEDCNNVSHPDYSSFVCQYYRNDTFARQTPYAAVREYLLLILRNTTFNGVTGLVRLSPTGERKGSYSINSLNSSNGWVEVGYYTTTGQLILHQSIIWPDGTTTVPRDASLIIPTVVTISDEAYSAMSILAAAGIVVIFAYLIFNITRRHLPIIRLSSPRINTVALLGSVPAFICVFLLGIDTDEKHDFTLICQLRLWLLSMAFTATFGSLFAKTLRVQQIFRRANSLVAAKIHDWQLLVVVVFFLCIDVLLLGIWTIIDPLRHTVVHLDLRPHPNNNDIFYAPILNTCDCSSPLLWFGLLFCYKGILLLFGAYIAFDIRHVQVEALNDSRWIGFSIYNVAVLTLIIVPASFLLSDNAHETIYIISCTGIVVMAVATTSLMFLPKIILSRGTNQWNTNQPNTMMDDGHGSIDTSVMKNNTGISTLDTMLNVNPSRIRQLESEIFALRRRLLKYEEDLDKDDIPYATKPNVSGKQNSSHGTGTSIPAIPMQTLNKDKQLPPAPVNGKYSPPIAGKYSPAPNGKYSPAPIPSPSPDTTQPVIRHFTSQRGRFRVPSSAKKHIVKDDISHDTIQEPTIIPDPTETNTPFTSTPPLPDSTSTSTLLQPISGTNTPMVGASPTLMSDSLASRTHSEHWRPGETHPTYMITENTPPVSSVENTP